MCHLHNSPERSDFNMIYKDAFKETIRLHLRAGFAYNNLAQILMEQGRHPEAREMARKAVSLGGPLQAVFQQTLEEIESKMSQ
jgi:hypothetical protein